MLRSLSGLVRPDAGRVRLAGGLEDPTSRQARRRFALVPSGERTFYLRLSGLENLVFFARLAGFSRREGIRRADACLEAVDLMDQRDVRVGTYSHGMQKRLAIARALLTDPPVLLFDEATHDLDPPSARRIQDLVRRSATGGAAVIWATQRVEEIRGFCDSATLLHRGEVRFDGTVPELMTYAAGQRYVLHLRPRHGAVAEVAEVAGRATRELATVTPLAGERDRYVVTLHEGVSIGDAIAALVASGLDVVACTRERSEIEDAFMSLIGDGS